MFTRIKPEILDNRLISREEASQFLHEISTEDLCGLADEMRRRFMGDRMDTCSIMNARSGRCTEDCKWCSQSSHHACDVEIYPLTGTEEALRHAKDNYSKGIGRFSLVTSGRAMTDREIDRSGEIYGAIGQACPDLKLCASMGLLNKEQLQRLKESGVERYHCNIETAPSYFPKLCTTHTMEEKIRTIRWAQEVGLKVCSGGIIGMGETAEQRVEMAFTLRDLEIDSIPVNILNPIPGTKLERTPPLTDDEILRTFALFRIINPKAYIRFAGGRTRITPEVQRAALKAGVNAAIMGDLLTTIGCTVEEDKRMFASAGFTM